MAEYAFLAQGRKIAARPFGALNCAIRPVASWPPGLFAFLGPASCGGVAMLRGRLDHWRSAARLAKLGRRKATEQARKTAWPEAAESRMMQVRPRDRGRAAMSPWLRAPRP